MSSVLAFGHRGVACAIPADQAHAIEVDVDPAVQGCLWEGAGEHLRAVEVRTSSGLMWVGCDNPRILPLPRQSALGLSPLLRRVLGRLPHVVGMVTLEGCHTWLVDLSRYPVE